MYIKNSMGPRTVPWGTPEMTGWEEDCVPSEPTLCLGQGPGGFYLVMLNKSVLNYYSHFSSLFPDFFPLSCSTPPGASFLIKKIT